MRKPEGKEALGRPWHRWEEWISKKRVPEGVDWISLVQEGDI
jgi:hypothetical protein